MEKLCGCATPPERVPGQSLCNIPRESNHKHECNGRKLSGIELKTNTAGTSSAQRGQNQLRINLNSKEKANLLDNMKFLWYTI